MPYDLSLQTHCLPEFYAEPPESWLKRLREVSPITERLAHLRFRYFAPRDDWYYQDRGIWALYSCTPAAMVPKERALQFEQHWSELPKEFQVGRKAMVSNYQHFMWTTQRVEAKPFWFLQGEWGGTPAQYTRREERMLDACGAISEPFPIGFFPGAPFNELAVKKILERDRFYQASNNFDDLEKMDRASALKAEDDAAEKEFRTKWLDWWYEQIQPQKEFMSSTLFKSAAQDLPAAPEGLERTLATFKDTFIEEGVVEGAGVASSKKIQIAVR